ncbi:Maltase 1, partial [Trachymyrmex cornetzi]
IILLDVTVTYYGEEIGMVDKMDISWMDTQDPQACNAGKDKYKSRSRDPHTIPMELFQKCRYQSYKIINLSLF